MITLTEAHVKELEAYIQELPVKYGLPLINFLNKAAKESQEPESKSVSVEQAEDILQD